jgi:hypothetical protein
MSFSMTLKSLHLEMITIYNIYVFYLVNYKSIDLCRYLQSNSIIQHHHEISYNNSFLHGVAIALITKVDLQLVIMLPFGWANVCWLKGSLGMH